MLKGVEQIYHNDFWSSKDFADAKVVCGKTKTTLPVNRCVLATISPFFDRGFKNSMLEAAEARVTINDAEPVVMEMLLFFLYTGRLESASNDHATALLPLAHRCTYS